MKVNKVMKKIVTLITVFSLILGIFEIVGNTKTVDAATNPVSLYYCNYIVGKYGYSEYDIAVRINSSAQNKAVYIHYNSSGEWLNEEAHYVTTLSDGSEIWEAKAGSWGFEYAIEYVGDGQTYWDNNNGNNYTGSTILGDANIKLKRPSSYDVLYGTNNFNVTVNLKNLAYTKVVKVRYTEDNWATYSDVVLSYHSTNSETSLEEWGTTLSLDAAKKDSFQYAIYYNVNGQTYWDNNLGRNYDLSYYAPAR